MDDVETTTQRVEDILESVPIFSRLDKRGLKKLAGLCVPKTFGAGETILEEGGVALGLYIVTSGRAEVFQGRGDDKVSLGANEGGGVIGEIALIDGQPRTASVVAQTPTECLLLTRDRFATLIKEDPEIAWCIVPSLAEKVRELQARAIGAEERLRASKADPSNEPDYKESEMSAKKVEADKQDDDAASEASETLARMMRMPYGLMLGGLAGMTAMTKAAETFFVNLADETDLSDSDSLSDVAEKAPDGFVAASRKAMSDLESVPQQMVDGFRTIYKE
jgi:CRP/FNR family transcriptional regulator, cyclic AMP receptor protein